MNYAIIDTSTNLVVNVIIWDGNPPWQPPTDTIAVPLSDGAGIGWSYVDGVFNPPEPAAVDP